MAKQRDPHRTPTWREFHSLLKRKGLATSFVEAAWDRYSSQYKRDLYRAIEATTFSVRKE